MSLLKDYQLSPAQRAAVQSSARQIVVTAGAGTGKTHTLVARYLHLLEQHGSPRPIVAITFTRKAAREMRNRIRDAVWRALQNMGPDDLAWHGMFAQLDAARIDTIHGLCAELLRSHPLEAGVEPGFGMLDETQAALLRRHAIDDSLTWAAEQPWAGELFAAFTGNTLHDLLKQILSRRLDLAPALQATDDAEELLAAWRSRLQEAQARAWQALVSQQSWHDCYRFLAQTTPLAPDDKLAPMRLAAFDAMQALQQGPDAQACRHIRALKLQGGSQKNWPGGKDTVKELKDWLRWLRNSISKDYPELGWELGPQDEAWAHLWPGLRNLADEALRLYELARRERHALDFDDLEEKALTLLQRHPRLREHWQKDIAALLVDEFQDTNQRQRDLIRHLQGPDTSLFVVGDAKQSIYRFRGAEVEVFRLEQEQAQAQGAAIRLAQSYRSHAALIDWQNAALAPVLGDSVSAAEPWQSPFEPLQAVRSAALDELPAPYVELYLARGPKNEALLQSARAVASRLVAWLQAGAYQADDIAILCRASSSFHFYEDALEEAGIPFITVAGRGFYDRPEIRELLLLLRAAADPEDSIALAGALRSAVIGLSDYALWLLARDAHNNKETTWWPALSRAAQILPADEQERAAEGLALLQHLRGLAGRVTVGELLAALLNRSHVLAMLAAVGGQRAMRNVQKLLNDAQAAGVVHVSEFVDYVAVAKGEMVKEGDAPLLSQGAVQIMSVHKAKGMEFPIVVIGDLGYGHPGRDTLIINNEGAWHAMKDDQDAATMFKLFQAQQKSREEAESRRLLYVAATRARERLLLSGHWPANRQSFSGWGAPLLASLDLPTALSTNPKPDPGAARTLYLSIGGQTVLCHVSEPGWQAPAARLPSPALSHAHPAPAFELAEPLQPAPAPHDDGKQESAPPQRVWRITTSSRQAYAPAWAVGKLVHYALQHWRFPNEDGFDPWLTAYARTLGMVEQPQIRRAVQQAARMVQRLQKSSLGQEIDDAEVRRHEAPYVLDRQRGIIDLLYRANGQWTVVDFKTDRLQSIAAAQKILVDKGYDEQLQRYCRALQAFLAQRPRAVLCFLNVDGRVWTWQLPA